MDRVDDNFVGGHLRFAIMCGPDCDLRFDFACTGWHAQMADAELALFTLRAEA